MIAMEAALFAKPRGTLACLALAALLCLALATLNGCEREPQMEDGSSVATKGCMACHAANEGPGFAPSFAVISKRYAGSKDAAARLAESLKSGSHGKWTGYPGTAMPPQSQLSEEERKALARSILRQ